MDARNLTAIPHSDAGSLEVIVRWGCGHTLVKPRVSELSAKWHYHPQIEIHLIP